MSEGLRKPKEKPKAQVKSTGKMYRGFGSKTNKVVVDILYREKDDIIKAYKELGHNYSSIARILQLENANILGSLGGSKGKPVTIEYYHIKQFLHIIGIAVKKKVKLTNEEREELIKLLEENELTILRRAHSEGNLAISKDYKNATPYWSNKVIKGTLRDK
jgi:transposase-like protein